MPFRFQLLVYPVTDARGRTDSYEELSEGFSLTRAGMAWFLGHYLSGGQGAPDDPRVSPLLADDGAFAASPPTLVITAELDPLRDEGEAYAERLREAGVVAEATRYDGMFHSGGMPGVVTCPRASSSMGRCARTARLPSSTISVSGPALVAKFEPPCVPAFMIAAARSSAMS